MSTRQLGAVIRLDLLRGKKAFVWSGGAAVVAVVLVLLIPAPAGLPIAAIALMLTMFAAMGPIGSLTSDKMLGHLEFDRCLPFPLRTVAAGRLIGASLRTSPVMVAAIAVGVGIAGGRPGLVEWMMVLAGAFVMQLVTWWLIWALLAVNARFSLRRLWWVPMSIWLLPSLIPEPMMDAAAAWLESHGTALFDQMNSSGRIVLVGIAGVLLPTLLAFVGSMLLFRSGLTHFRPDPAAMGMPLGKAPKRELAALGRGPLLAVARLRLRLSLEQFRRELAIAVVLLVVIVADIGSLGSFARSYLPILAVLMPGGVALQLMTGRVNGSLEGLQHLPQPRRQTALGHLVAVAIMAVPGALLIAAGWWAEGVVLVPGAVVGRWLWYVVVGWVLAVGAVWLTPRRGIAAAGIAVVVLAAVATVFAGRVEIQGIRALIALWAELRVTLQLLLPSAFLLVAVLVGLPLFSAGLKGFRPGASRRGG